MTGTGTQTDPYIVMNADELVEATSTSEGGNTRYVKLGADINMDGRSNVNMYFYELDGDGHSIMNINVENTNGLVVHVKANNTTIKNISFTSCSAKLSGALIAFTRDITTTLNINIYNCDFSVKITSTASTSSGVWLNLPGGTSSAVVTLNIERCVADITYISEGYMHNLTAHGTNYSTINIKWSHINIDAKFATNNRTARLFDLGGYNYCYLTGKVEGSTSGAYADSSIFYGAFNNSYAAVHGTQVVVPLMSGSTSGVVFYDSDIYTANTDLKFKHLTTAQCKDIEYLNSIGFDVVPGE